MKTVFDKTTRDELISRISSLNLHSNAHWGKMNVGQMMRHCTQWDEMALGRKVYKQSFIGKVFGRVALKDMLKDSPIKRNLPTVPSFKVTGDINVVEEKNKWITQLGDYASYDGDGFVHPFFGTLTKEQVGVIVYKHIDHHLRQFNA